MICCNKNNVNQNISIQYDYIPNKEIDVGKDTLIRPISLKNDYGKEYIVLDKENIDINYLKEYIKENSFLIILILLIIIIFK